MTRQTRRPRPPRRPGVRRRPHPHVGRRRRRLPGRPATPAAGQGGTACRPRRDAWSATPTALEHRQPGGRPVEDGDALVIATSGSTGDPKGVVLTHDAVAASAAASSARLERHRPTTTGSPASRSPTSAAWPSSPEPSARAPRLTVLPRFDPRAVQSASAPRWSASSPRRCAASTHQLPPRRARRCGAARRPPGQRRRPPTG